MAFKPCFIIFDTCAPRATRFGTGFYWFDGATPAPVGRSPAPKSHQTVPRAPTQRRLQARSRAPRPPHRPRRRAPCLERPEHCATPPTAPQTAPQPPIGKSVLRRHLQAEGSAARTGARGDSPALSSGPMILGAHLPPTSPTRPTEAPGSADDHLDFARRGGGIGGARETGKRAIHPGGSLTCPAQRSAPFPPAPKAPLTRPQDEPPERHRIFTVWQ